MYIFLTYIRNWGYAASGGVSQRGSILAVVNRRRYFLHVQKGSQMPAPCVTQFPVSDHPPLT